MHEGFRSSNTGGGGRSATRRAACLAAALALLPLAACGDRAAPTATERAPETTVRTLAPHAPETVVRTLTPRGPVVWVSGRQAYSAPRETSVAVGGAEANRRFAGMLRQRLAPAGVGAPTTGLTMPFASAQGTRDVSLAALIDIFDGRRAPADYPRVAATALETGPRLSESCDPAGGACPASYAETEETETPPEFRANSTAEATYDGFEFYSASYARPYNYPDVATHWLGHDGRRTVSVPNGGPMLYDERSSVEGVIPLEGGAFTAHWPNVAVGSGCSFTAGLGSVHTLWWQPSTGSRRTSTLNSVGSASINRPCNPPPSTADGSKCDDPDLPGCEPDGTWTGGVGGRPAFASAVSAPAARWVCDVIDWYENGVYVGTEVIACWME